MIPFAAESLSRIAHTLYQERLQSTEARPRPEPGYASAQSEHRAPATGAGRRHRR